MLLSARNNALIFEYIPISFAEFTELEMYSRCYCTTSSCFYLQLDYLVRKSFQTTSSKSFGVRIPGV